MQFFRARKNIYDILQSTYIHHIK